MTALVRLSQSRWNYYAGFVVDLGGTAFLLGLCVGTWRGPWWHAGLLVVLGLLLYTLIQYSGHRWGGHGPIRAWAEGHAYHHAHPEAYAAMPFFVYPLAIFCFWRVFQVVLPLPEASLLAGAMYAGSCWDGIAHHWQHRQRPGAPLASECVPAAAAPELTGGAHHLRHHADPCGHFGQTTALWDRIFGTAR